MAIVGNIIVYIIMACMAVGGVASIIKPKSELGQQFIEGIQSIGPIFLSVAGIFASIPFLSSFISAAFGPLFELVGGFQRFRQFVVLAAERDADISLSVAAEDKSRGDEYARFVQYPFGQFLYIGATVGYLSPKEHAYLVLVVSTSQFTHSLSCQLAAVARCV